MPSARPPAQSDSLRGSLASERPHVQNSHDSLGVVDFEGDDERQDEQYAASLVPGLALIAGIKFQQVLDISARAIALRRITT